MEKYKKRSENLEKRREKKRKALVLKNKQKGRSSIGWQSVDTSTDFAENRNKVRIVAVKQSCQP
jgi:hypothetical protein